jgi:hypothetical protein
MSIILGLSPLFTMLAVTVQRPFSVGLAVLFGATAGARILKYRKTIRKRLKLEFILSFILIVIILFRVLSDFRLTGDVSGPAIVILLGICSLYVALCRSQNWLNMFFISFVTLMNVLCLIAFFKGSLGQSRSGALFEIPVNLFGIYCALASCISLYVLHIESNLKESKSIFLIFSFLIASIGVLHTSSYGAIIAYVVTLISFQIFRLRLFQRILSLVGVASILALSFSNVTLDPFDSSKKSTKVSESIVTQTNNLSASTDKGRPLLTPRNDMLSSSVSDRVFIAEESLDGVFSQGFWNFILGGGSLVAETDLVLPSSGSESRFVPHNAFISFTKSYGILSLTLLLAIIAKSLYRARKNQNLSVVIPFLPVWTSSLFIDLQWTYLFMIFMMSLSSFWIIVGSESRLAPKSKDL